MQTIQEVIVNERIADLRREAESLRMEQRCRRRRRDHDRATAAAGSHRGGRRARVLLGHWLIGIGIAVSGSAGDAQGEAARTV